MKRILFFITILLTFVSGAAKVASDTTVADSAAPDDSLTVSLVTCFPGPDIYALCGHEGIRIQTAKSDSIWNYGLFDFNTPNFATRFALGQTDYMVAGYPFEWFMPEYVARGSKVVEQVLNLTPQEARDIRAALRTVSLPQNNTYRYNYVRRNCATEIRDLVDTKTRSRIIFTDSVRNDTFRKAMRSYHKNYPWYQFGIDIALGPGIDKRINSHEEMFAPVDMMQKFATAHFDDGRPVVKQTTVIFEGKPDAILPPTPWYLTPLFFASLIFLFSFGVIIYKWKTGKDARWWISLWSAATGIAGCIITFLVFFSSHEATGSNLLILWLNPLQFVPAIAVWTRKRPLTAVFCWLNIVVVGSLLIIWPFLRQVTASAVFPLMGATILTAISFLLHGKNRSAYTKPAAAPGRKKPSSSRRQPATKKRNTRT